MAEPAVQEKKGNLTDYMNCNCRRDGGMSGGGKAPDVVYQAPKNVQPGKIVSDAPAVTTIQQFLNKEGANGQKPKESVKEDGRWGTGTSTAFYRRMVELQEKNGINPTGQYNKDTAEALRKNGMGKEADALDKMKNEGTLDRVYNHRLAKVICDGKEAAANLSPQGGVNTPQQDNTKKFGLITEGNLPTGTKPLGLVSEATGANGIRRDGPVSNSPGAIAAHIIETVRAMANDVAKAQPRSIGNERGAGNPGIAMSKAPNLTTSEKAQMAECTKSIQATLGISQTGQYDTKTDAALSKRITQFQSQSIILTNSRTGVYDEKTAEVMRRSSNPEIKQLVKAMDRMGQIEDRAAERTRALTGQPETDKAVKSIAKPVQPVKEQAASGVISLNKDELKRADEADRQIQKAIGVPQTGYLNSAEKSMLKTMVKESQNAANLPETGEYDAKTAKAMREDANNPKAQQLARALDSKDAVYQDAIKRSIASEPARISGNNAGGNITKEKMSANDLVGAGRIKSGVVLTEEHGKAVANQGAPLDNRPTITPGNNLNDRPLVVQPFTV